jgi:hypothetical protein
MAGNCPIGVWTETDGAVCAGALGFGSDEQAETAAARVIST